MITAAMAERGKKNLTRRERQDMIAPPHLVRWMLIWPAHYTLTGTSQAAQNGCRILPALGNRESAARQ